MTTIHRAYLFYRIYRKSHNITESLRYAYQQTFGPVPF